MNSNRTQREQAYKNAGTQASVLEQKRFHICNTASGLIYSSPVLCGPANPERLTTLSLLPSDAMHGARRNLE
jgi:hypothetical protein